MFLTFLTPAILLGGILIAVPIVIHLIMRRQPKHLLFPAFRFLQLKHRTNVQKLRLRHLLLLAMRILLILLICAALARPELSGGIGSLAIDSPVGVVLILDTSSSMDYEHSGKTRLADAKERAVELLQQLPAGSQAAILDTAELVATFTAVREAIKRVQGRQTRPQNRPVTSSLEEAYRLLDNEAPPDLPVIVCVFSDRTAASWNSAMVANYLLPLKNRVDNRLGHPLPAVYFDVSAPEVRNAAITGLSLKSGGGDAGIPLEKLTFGAAVKETLQFQAAVRVTGTNIDSQLVLAIDDKVEDTKRIKLETAAGETKQTVITFRPLPRSAKAYQGQVYFKSGDLLEADNARYWTIVVPERKVLTIVDREEDADAWRTALEHLPIPLTCEVTVPGKLPQSLHPDAYQVVCLLDVAKPGKDLWEMLHRYVADGGGLLILPGPNADRSQYVSDAAQSVMPARLKEIATPKPPEPAAFLTPDFSHPIMAFFKDREYRDLSPFKARQFWQVELLEGGSSLVAAPYSINNWPAIVERTFDPQKVRGRVVLLTTAMYRRDDPTWKDWNNYIETWFYQGLAYATIRHVLGAREEPGNVLLGDDLRFWLPRGPGFTGYLLSGPAPGTGKVEPGQTQLAIREAVRPGNYKIIGGDDWRKVFSVNLPPLETHLTADRPEASEIALLFGEEPVIPLADAANIAELVRSRLGQSPKRELLPLLMIAVLFLLAGENLLANRFYRREPEGQRLG